MKIHSCNTVNFIRLLYVGVCLYFRVCLFVSVCFVYFILNKTVLITSMPNRSDTKILISICKYSNKRKVCNLPHASLIKTEKAQTRLRQEIYFGHISDSGTRAIYFVIRVIIFETLVPIIRLFSEKIYCSLSLLSHTVLTSWPYHIPSFGLFK